MSQFSVTPGALQGAAARIDVDENGSGTLPSASLAGAASATPIDGAWSTFLGDALGATTAVNLVSMDLAAALRMAGGNYADADTSSGHGLRQVP